MHQHYDKLLAGMVASESPNPQELRKEYQDLGDTLHDWGTLAFPAKSFEWYVMLKNHHLLPFPGSWEDQPRYVQEDIVRWTILERWHQINNKLSDARDLPQGIEGARAIQ